MQAKHPSAIYAATLALLWASVGVALLVCARPTEADPAVDADLVQGQNLDGESYIQLNREPGGDILVGTSANPTNQNGAFVWDGATWRVNNTWAHTYFTDIRTGQRIVSNTPVITLESRGISGMVFQTSTYGIAFTVTARSYTYAVPARAPGTYTYEAIEYVADWRCTYDPYRRLDWKVVLRSRGSGNGTAYPYFDIYVQTWPTRTDAFRGDPVWYLYDSDAEHAVQFASETAGRTGYLPTADPPERARYWLDTDGGSDMGGFTYFLRTGALPCRTRDKGSSFPIEFRFMWYDAASNTVKGVIVLPAIKQETANLRLNIPLVHKR